MPNLFSSRTTWLHSFLKSITQPANFPLYISRTGAWLPWRPLSSLTPLCNQHIDTTPLQINQLSPAKGRERPPEEILFFESPTLSSLHVTSSQLKHGGTPRFKLRQASRTRRDHAGAESLTHFSIRHSPPEHFSDLVEILHVLLLEHSHARCLHWRALSPWFAPPQEFPGPAGPTLLTQRQCSPWFWTGAIKVFTSCSSLLHGIPAPRALPTFTAETLITSPGEDTHFENVLNSDYRL